MSIEFLVTSLIVIVSPGTGVLYTLAAGLSRGSRASVVAAFGCTLGIVPHMAAAVTGLAALLHASALAFEILKYLGVAYLLWLALQAIRHGTALTLAHGAAKPQSLRRVLLTGAGINLLNPKIVMFFLTFLPQFVSASDPQASGTLFFLGLYFIVLCLPICIPMILMANRFTGALRRSPRIMRAFDWLFAGLMGAFAVRLLLARSS